MDTKALILFAALLAGCATFDNTGKRVSAAAVTQGQAKAERPKLVLPPACTALVERVKLRDEPWVVFRFRWEVSADNRDQMARDCQAWAEDYNKQNAGNR
jgi:hypothetical protein